MSELDKSLINLVHSLASSFPDYYTDEDVREVIDEIAAKNEGR